MVELDKRLLHSKLKERLAAELERAQKRAKEAADGATHEENRAEGDKDMRATEASYVARGHSSRVTEMEEALLRVNALELLEFEPGARIAVSALVELEHQGRRLHYFLMPAGGGERVELSGVQVQTITTQSPLGAALLGLTEGDEAELPGRDAGGARSYEVIRVR
jgi:transcription elongation GreA/GreB family factor